MKTEPVERQTGSTASDTQNLSAAAPKSANGASSRPRPVINYETPKIFYFSVFLFSVVPIVYFFEADPVWQWEQAVDFSVRYWWLYFLSGFPYLPLIWWMIKYMKHKNPYNLRLPLILHNFILTFFNIVVCWYTFPLIWNYYQAHGWNDLICTNGVLRVGGEGGRMIFLFGIFKIPELLDTVFLILRKKSVILLHWFHHFTVMLYCWSISFAYDYNSGGEASIFAAMNAFIHVIMYAYYGTMAMRAELKRKLGFELPPWMPQFITVIQIIQMILGMALEANKFLTCKDCQYLSSVYAGMAMYISYFILFSLYFYDRYIKKGSKEAMD